MFDDYIITPVKNITKEEYNGNVYNLETEDQTYLVSNAIVHNCARLQTFPDWFAFSGSYTDARVQLGNAVPPLASKTIARAVYSVLSALR